MNDYQFEKGKKYEIFIGIKDKDTYEEYLDVYDFQNILAEICTEKELSFSLLTQTGGYSHNKGYTIETSMRIIIIGAAEDEIILLGKKLMKIINTDTILITKTDIEYCFMI